MGADRVEFEWKEWENMVDQQVMCRSDLLGSGLMQNIVAKKFGLEGRSILWKVVNMSWALEALVIAEQERDMMESPF